VQIQYLPTQLSWDKWTPISLPRRSEFVGVQFSADVPNANVSLFFKADDADLPQMTWETILFKLVAHEGTIVGIRGGYTSVPDGTRILNPEGIGVPLVGDAFPINAEQAIYMYRPDAYVEPSTIVQ
jgi:hypothetical protein